MSDASCTSNYDLRPQDMKVRDVLQALVCHQNHSNKYSKLRDQIQLIKEAVSFPEIDLTLVVQEPIVRI